MRRSRTHNRPHGSAMLFGALAASVAACSGGSVPRPPTTQVLASDYVPVAFAPRAPRVEIVPSRPVGGAVWVDGSWSWEGGRYRWEPGGWVLPPPGARLARWVIVRRDADGQLFFAPTTWKNERGEIVPDPAPLARARAGAAESDE